MSGAGVETCPTWIRFLAAMALMWWAGAAALNGQAGGSIAGSVVGDDGKAVAGALVAANRTTAPAASARVQADGKGEFRFTNLAPGTYTLCAAVAGGGYLDPCTWSVRPVAVRVAAGSAVTGIQVAMQKAATVRVRVEDPDGLAGKAAAARQAPPRVLLGIVTPRGVVEPLQAVSEDAKGSTHAGAAPVDGTPVSVQVSARGARVLDAAGVEVGAGGRSVAVARGSDRKPKDITLTLKERKP